MLQPKKSTEQKKMEGFQTHDKYNQLSEPRSIKNKPEMGRREEEEEGMWRPHKILTMCLKGDRDMNRKWEGAKKRASLEVCTTVPFLPFTFIYLSRSRCPSDRVHKMLSESGRYL